MALKQDIDVVVFAAHPEKGNTVLSLLIKNDGYPIAQRVRDLAAKHLGEGWTIFDWQTTDIAA